MKPTDGMLPIRWRTRGPRLEQARPARSWPQEVIEDTPITREYWIHDVDGSDVQLVGYETGSYDIDIRNKSADLNTGAFETGSFPFKVLLDEVCMCGRALSPAEIRGLEPGPATLSVLGLGVLALIRRRRDLASG